MLEDQLVSFVPGSNTRMQPEDDNIVPSCLPTAIKILLLANQ